MKTEASIELTATEACWLVDKIKTFETGTEDQRIVPYRALERLGSVMLELTGEDAPETLSVVLTEAELWHAKDRVSPFDALGADKQFGLRLLRKILAALLGLQDPQLWPVREHTEPSREEIRHALLAHEVEGMRGTWDETGGYRD